MIQLSRAPTRHPLPDAQLLREIAAGDIGALGQLYDRYARDVWRIVRRLLDVDADVDDVVHSLFLALPRIAGSYDGRASCRGWLIGIAVRFTMRHRRGRSRFRRMLEAFARTVREPWMRQPEREAANREELSILQRALDQLAVGALHGRGRVRAQVVRRCGRPKPRGCAPRARVPARLPLADHPARPEHRAQPGSAHGGLGADPQRLHADVPVFAAHGVSGPRRRADEPTAALRRRDARGRPVGDRGDPRGVRARR